MGHTYLGHTGNYQNKNISRINFYSFKKYPYVNNKV